LIHELRILPPLAIARFGSAPTPMDNYDAVADPANPLGYRELRPAETLEVDADSGEIARSFVPETLSFTENGAVRPVAPFLEVWALVGDEALTGGGRLEALTTALLEQEGASAADLRWQVDVANLKVMRRTGQADDAVRASSGEFSDHARHELVGECDNFLPGKTISFGHVQYIRPTENHPEIRLRFTPAAGRIYGSNRQPFPDEPTPDPHISDIVYNARRGSWDGHRDDRDDPGVTRPWQIYAGREIDGRQVSAGYLDDGCDGLVRVKLEAGGRTLEALGRVGSGPPTYAPDAWPIRTVADELEQALFGPEVDPEDATFERVEEILRRAFETVRLMNTTHWNVEGMGGRRPIMAPSLVDPVAVENLHQSLLVALRSGTAPWFGDVLRDHDDAADHTVLGRRKMPAMMRGADGHLMTLTRRQIALIRTLARGPLFSDEEEPEP
jgi:hypothetical protein